MNQDQQSLVFWNTAYDVDPYHIDTQKSLVALYKNLGKEALAKKHQSDVDILSGDQMERENTSLLWR